MEDSVINFLARLGKQGTFTFGLISSFNAGRYTGLAILGTVSVDEIFRDKNRYLNRFVNVTGEAQGETYSVANS